MSKLPLEPFDYAESRRVTVILRDIARELKCKPEEILKNIQALQMKVANLRVKAGIHDQE